jgi:hypothetical protein
MEKEKSEIENQNNSRISRFAVYSFIFAIISPFTLGFTIIPGIIFGIIGLIKIKKSNGSLTGKGFADAAIVISTFFFILYLGMSLIALNHQMPSRMYCSTNMAGLGKAMMIYVNNFDGYPTPEKWCDLLIEHCEVTPKSFLCKEANEGPCNYAINKYITNFGATDDPNIVVLFETNPGWNQVGGPEILTLENHKGKGFNVVFLDTHTDFIKA